ncbi:MAG TPA: TetR/AcrR family transcriptional regulator [Pseudonocardiaceae bacterium]|jgi:AcrR family transcriptional regulator|nr:TetR/AcrR family transcriptional regulator [Pseudonocardiaceae bacterium]
MTTTGVSGTQVGRRVPQRWAAVCDSVFELLAEVGYDRMTMDAVAARAHVSKATIYRTWPNKPDLVADSLAQHFAATAEPDDTGSLRGDLLALMDRACHFGNSKDGEVIAGVMTAAARCPVLARTMYEFMFEKKRVVHETILRRAAERGEIPSDVKPDLLHETMFSMVLSRRLTNPQPMDRAYSEHVVDDVLLPVLRHQSAA